MRIEEYFDTLRKVIDESIIIQSAKVTYDKRSSRIGFIRGALYLLDGSQLHFREFIDTNMGIERYMYAYHYQQEDGKFVFRYDNTDHHRSLNLATHPHHKHAGAKNHVVNSHAPALAEVLSEVENLLDLGSS